jgi:hypothetical protein
MNKTIMMLIMLKTVAVILLMYCYVILLSFLFLVKMDLQ